APQTVELQQRLRDEFAPREADLLAFQAELQRKAETFNRDAPVMGEAERTALERELQQGQRDLQRRDTELREDLNYRQNELLTELQRNIVQRVQNYADAEGYDLIVTDVVYVSDNIDITEAVLAAISSGAGASN
ncbi:MAG: OmpH family outer membrane protein, partial [Gammaproteobacteria bacterium]|nr:OmpH family outer membrane protein [Gammaproteobacteria bacterium]